jgi:hypothetical protein
MPRQKMTKTDENHVGIFRLRLENGRNEFKIQNLKRKVWAVLGPTLLDFL